MENYFGKLLPPGLALGIALLPIRLFAATVTWVGGSGNWATATNWSTGALPGTDDEVVIASGPAITVTYSSGANTVNSIQSQQAFVLSGGALTVSSTFQANNALTLSGGTLQAATVVVTNGSGLVVQSGSLDGVTVNGLLDVGHTYSGANLTVTNGLVLNGTAWVGNPTNSDSGQIQFAGSQTLGGSGTAVLGNNGVYNALRLPDGGTTLTIGSGITVRGQNGTIGYDIDYGGPQNVSVINQGTISCDVSDGMITINAQPFANQGLAQALNGGGLALNDTWSNTGTLVASGGTLNLAGNFATAELGLINQTNGTINLTGTLNNSNATLTVNTASGAWVLNGGTVLGGAITTPGGASLVVNNGTMNGVTVNGLLDVGNTYNGASLTVTNGLVLNGTALVGNPTNSYAGAIQFAGSQTLGGSGTAVLGNNGVYNALRLPDGGATLTIGSGITVRGQNGTIGYDIDYGGPQNVSVVNQGTIACDVSDGTITINAQPFANQGLAQALNGGALTLNDTWSNTGTLVASDGAIDLAGSFATGELGTINQTNGTINLTGTLNNSNATLTVNAASGAWVLNGGTVLGGAITTPGGASLVVNNGTMNGVTVNGLLDVGNIYNGASLTVTNGLVLNGTALVGNPTNSHAGAIQFAGSQTLGGSGTAVLGNNGVYNALRLLDGGTTLTIGSGITVRGQNGTIGYSSPFGGPQNVSVVNQGTISCDVNGGTIAINAQPFANQGLAQALNGGALTLNDTWSNTGTLVESGGTLTLAGSFATAELGLINQTNGTINLNGTLNNSNATLTVNTASGSWVLNGGTVLGGAITTAGGASLVVNNGTLNGVTVNGLLDVGHTYNGANLTVTNGLVLNGTAWVGNPTNSDSGQIQFAGSQTLGGSGTAVLGNNGVYNALRLPDGGTTLTIGSGITVRGQNGTIGYSSPFGGPQNVSVINQGTISCDVTGGTIALTPQSFVNQGIVGAFPGSITANAGFDSTAGTLAVDLGSSSSYAQINISGNATLGGTLNVVLTEGYVPAISNSFAVITYGSFSGSFNTINLPMGPLWQTNYGATAFSLLVTEINKLVFTTQPTGAIAGAILAPVVVQVENAATGSSVATNGVPVTMALASGGGTLSGVLTTNTDATGKATFNDLSFSLIGTKTLLASASAAEITPATSASFTMTYGPASQLVLLSAIASPQGSGIVFSPPPQVQVQDQFGNVVLNSTAPITAGLSSSNGGTWDGSTTVNANGTSGSAAFTNLLYTLSNPHTNEPIVVYFASPGLKSVTNPMVMVYGVFNAITLSNNNAVVQIDPASERGMYAWRVDGTNQVYQLWFWLGGYPPLPQTSFDPGPFHLGEKDELGQHFSRNDWTWVGGCFRTRPWQSKNRP